MIRKNLDRNYLTKNLTQERLFCYVIKAYAKPYYVYGSTDEESNSTANSSGTQFLYNSKGLVVISLLVKYYVPLAHINKVLKLLKFLQ